MNYKYEKLVANIVGGLLVVGVLTLCLLVVSPVDILKNWNIKTTAETYKVNGTIQVVSNSIKLRKATASVRRTIECDSGADGTIGYNLNLSQGKRAPGTHSSVYELKIPSNITDLPATCRVVIIANYKIYGFRHIIENTVSNNFRVVQ